MHEGEGMVMKISDIEEVGIVHFHRVGLARDRAGGLGAFSVFCICVLLG